MVKPKSPNRYTTQEITSDKSETRDAEHVNIPENDNHDLKYACSRFNYFLTQSDWHDLLASQYSHPPTLQFLQHHMHHKNSFVASNYDI
jgi:hypothetical protein